MARLAGKPVLVLKKGTRRRKEIDARRNNIAAAKIVSEIVKSTLGPRGMDKMLVPSPGQLGDITITNDGATILRQLDLMHPAAKMMFEVARTQDDMVGDGTTAAVIIAGGLLKKAEELLNQKIHPTLIVHGYKLAAENCMKTLEKIAQPVKEERRDVLKKIALTAMHSKGLGKAREHFADIAIDAIQSIAKKREDTYHINIEDDIKILKKEGKSLLETELIDGLILDKEVVHSQMPKKVKKAKIALINRTLEIRRIEFSTQIQVKDPEQMKAYKEKEQKILNDIIEKITSSGANVVLCQKGISEYIQDYLGKEKILAVRRFGKADTERIAGATGATIITNLNDLKSTDLGYADLVEERRILEDKMLFIKGCKNPTSVGILIRAGLERFLDEAERSLKDALQVITDVIKEPQIVAGGGAIEAELAKDLKEFATKVGGREQLAIEAFAFVLESIPRTLAENAGLNPIDILIKLRSAHKKENGRWYGVNVFTGKIEDMMKNGVIEPLSVKKQALKSAVESTSVILRIDDIISSAKSSEPKPPKFDPEHFEKKPPYLE